MSTDGRYFSVYAQRMGERQLLNKYILYAVEICTVYAEINTVDHIIYFPARDSKHE